MGNGRNPGAAELLKLVQMCHLDVRETNLIIDQVKVAIMQWKKCTEEAGVGKSSTQMIPKYLSTIK